MESGRDAVDAVQQNKRAGWNVQWDVEVGGSGLEVNDDARFWWSGTNKWKERPGLGLACGTRQPAGKLFWFLQATQR